MSAASIPTWGDWQDWGEDCDACARHHQEDFLRARLARHPDQAAAAAEAGSSSTTGSPLSLGSPAFSPWGSLSAEGHEAAGSAKEQAPGWALRQSELAGALQASLQRSLRRGLSRMGHLSTRWAAPSPHPARWEGPGKARAGAVPRTVSCSAAPWVWGPQQGQSSSAGDEGAAGDWRGEGPHSRPSEQQQHQHTVGWTHAPESCSPGVAQKQGFLHMPAWPRTGGLGFLAPTCSLFGTDGSAAQPQQGALLPGAADNSGGEAAERAAHGAEGGLGGKDTSTTLAGGGVEEDQCNEGDDADSYADNASSASGRGSLLGSDALSESGVALGCTLIHSPATGTPDTCSLAGSHHHPDLLPSLRMVPDTIITPVLSLVDPGDGVITGGIPRAAAPMGVPVPRPQTAPAPMGCFRRLPVVAWPLHARSPLRSMEDGDPSSGPSNDAPGPRGWLAWNPSAGPLQGFPSGLARLPGRLFQKKGSS